MNVSERNSNELSLDPADWEAFRDLAHRSLDDVVDYLRDIRSRNAWTPIPEDVRNRLTEPPPEEPTDLAKVLGQFRRDVLPYGTGNVHPRFWAWVCGTGSATGVVADLLASGMNSLTLGFDQSAPSHIELQIIAWFKKLFSFPSDSSGLVVSGASMANFVAIAVGRTAKCGYDVRRLGMNAPGWPRLIAYASEESHSSVQKALELTGFGTDSFRRIPVDANYEIDLAALRETIAKDWAAGLKPAVLVGNAGTVNTGAIDPLKELSAIAKENDLWYVVDGAFGAISLLCTNPPRNLNGLEEADALVFDLHKWLHQPYNAGVVLVKDVLQHKRTFHLVPPYLDDPGGGLSAGPTDFSSYGVQLSRSFAALRVWLSFKTHGVGVYRALTTQNMEQAAMLDSLVRSEQDLELVAPTSLNIVNFRFNPGGLTNDELNILNARIVIALQEQGVAAPSSTKLNGRLSIRVCICNHRTRREDLRVLIAETLRVGGSLLER